MPITYTNTYSVTIAPVRGDNQIVPNIWIILSSALVLNLTSFILQTTQQGGQNLTAFVPWIACGY